MLGAAGRTGGRRRRRGSLRRRRAAVRRPSRRGAARASGSTTATWRRSRRSAGGSTGCRWRSSWRRRGCARSASKPWPTASISASPCSPASGRASTRGTAASTRSSSGPTSCSIPSTRRPSPTSRRSPAASISTPPRPCAARPTAAEERSARVVIDLVDKSMVQVVDPDEPRYRLLETLREFGQERLRDDRLARAGRGAPSASGSSTWPNGPPSGWTAPTRDAGRPGSTATSTTSAPPTPAPCGPATSPSPPGWWPPCASTPSAGFATRSPAGARRRCRWTGFERSPAAPVVLGVAAYGRWVRGDLDDRHRARPSLDRRRRGARRPVERPRRAGPRQRPVLQRGDAGSTALDGAHGRRGRGERLAGRPVARAVHVVGRRHVDRRRPRAGRCWPSGRPPRPSAAVRRPRAPRPPTPTAWRCGPATASRPSGRCASPPTSARRAGTGGSGRSR